MAVAVAVLDRHIHLILRLLLDLVDRVVVEMELQVAPQLVLQLLKMVLLLLEVALVVVDKQVVQNQEEELVEQVF
tara:strand:- start:661 stop:885 length:225 start_codon:yes stop_codon:yes gene_type:complete